eukprot:1153700-Pelagomonas_calceolata.AAC.1
MAWHNRLVAARASNRIMPPYLFQHNCSRRSRLTSSRPGAMLITSYQAKPTSSFPSSSCSHYPLRSRTVTRCKPAVVHFNEIKQYEDTRPGQQLEAAQRQHADLCKFIIAKVVALHAILLGFGGTCYREHTLNQFKQLGLDQQRALTLAQNLHAHSVKYAHKLVTTRRANENKKHFSQPGSLRTQGSLMTLRTKVAYQKGDVQWGMDEGAERPMVARRQFKSSQTNVDLTKYQQSCNDEASALLAKIPRPMEWTTVRH